MFPRGADAYIDDIGKLINLKDGSIRTAIDTGCGVSFIIILLNSFGLFLFGFCMFDDLFLENVFWYLVRK